jgi:hypothetical protein
VDAMKEVLAIGREETHKELCLQNRTELLPHTLLLPGIKRLRE